VIQSHVIEIEGALVGAAVRSPDGYRFVRLDVRLGELHGMVWSNLAELRSNVRLRALTLRGPARWPSPPAA